MALSAAVGLSGEDAQKAAFSIKAKAVSLNRHGAEVQLNRELPIGSTIMVRNQRFAYDQAIRIAPGNSRVVAKLTDQTPLLMDQQTGEGHVMVFASTFDNVANDFPLPIA